MRPQQQQQQRAVRQGDSAAHTHDKMALTVAS